VLEGNIEGLWAASMLDVANSVQATITATLLVTS